MIVRCCLIPYQPGRFFYESLKNIPIEANIANTNINVTIKTVKKYLESSIGIVDKQVHLISREQPDWIHFGIDGQGFLIEILKGKVMQGDILKIENNDLFVYEETNYIVE